MPATVIQTTTCTHLGVRLMRLYFSLNPPIGPAGGGLGEAAGLSLVTGNW